MSDVEPYKDSYESRTVHVLREDAGAAEYRWKKRGWDLVKSNLGEPILVRPNQKRATVQLHLRRYKFKSKDEGK